MISRGYKFSFNYFTPHSAVKNKHHLGKNAKSVGNHEISRVLDQPCPQSSGGTKKTRILLTPIGVTIFGVFTTFFGLAAVLVDNLLYLPHPLPGGARLTVLISMVSLGFA